MKRALKWSLLALALCVPATAQAHRQWMLPSATVLSGEDQWITVDAAVSNDLFYFEHFPLRIRNLGVTSPDLTGGRGGRGVMLSIIAPDGTAVEPKNGNQGRYRTTFDFPISQKGTYKVALTNAGLFASYKEGGQTKRWSGSAEDYAKKVPANAQDLRASYVQSRIEVFVTSGKPTRETLKLARQGLELEPVTHPNDLVAGSASTFRLLLDGKPASNVEVEIVPGGNRYRERLGDFKVITDAEGKLTVKWPEAGMYWMEAVVRDEKSPVAEVKQRRASYIATLEVLP